MLISFQRPAVAACIRHIYSKERIAWHPDLGGPAIPIHPPAVVNASVSSGKSIMICELAAAIQANAQAKNNTMRTMIIQRQGELCEQNSDAAWSIGLQNSIYSASLNRKSRHFDVIYATSGTLARALMTAFVEHGPDLILVDESHHVGYEESESQFVQIFKHFYALKPHLRIIGFTGSPYRGAESIVGPFWNKILTLAPGAEGYPEGGVGNGEVSTEFMIAEGWVVNPQFGWPEHEQEDAYDFSQLQTNSGSWEYSEADLDEATGDVEKLQRICAEIVVRTTDRKGVLVFGSTHKHLKQIKASLLRCGVDKGQIGIITEKTKDKERRDILRRAKIGECKFVVNVGVLTTGVNVPAWDTVCFLRPIGSLVLLIQSIGRVLRLLLEEGGPSMVDMDAMTAEERLALIASSLKPDALVLDYGGVMDRLGDLYENPILEQAQKAHAERKKELITCPRCNAMNSIHARRCIGDDHGVRCEHFWKSTACECGTENDIVARSCRSCGKQLIDPNASLTGKHYTDSELVPVISQSIKAGSGGKITVRWVLADGREPYQIFFPNAGRDEAMKKINTRVFYNSFIKYHIQSSQWQFKARNMKAETVEKMQAMFSCPTDISARWSEESKRWNIGRRKFRDSGLIESDERQSETA